MKITHETTAIRSLDLPWETFIFTMLAVYESYQCIQTIDVSGIINGFAWRAKILQ